MVAERAEEARIHGSEVANLTPSYTFLRET